MSDTPPLLVEPRWLSQHPEVRIADLRSIVARRPPSGASRPATQTEPAPPTPPARQKYDEGHIPSAVFVDLDRDLAQPGGPGRHPFPTEEAFARLLGQLGIGPRTHVVVYDDASGSIAARLWFMLRVHGHERASLLDGGLKAWVEAGLPLSKEEPRVAPVPPPALKLDRSRVLDRSQVEKRGKAALLDARAPERYRGEIEPIDERAGHIPGALNAPFAANLTAAQRFRPPAELRKLYEVYGSDVIVSCGSGVTACHDAFAIELAGLPPARLYVGSWSDWSSDPSRPIATGAAPG
jgi:thiosulfate/3-mercaptopyruvate sulfurtransferase